MAVTKKKQIQRSFDWTPVVSVSFIVLGCAGVLFALPGAVFAWLGALVAAWGKRPPMLTGRKDARQAASPASPYEEKLLARYQASKQRRWALWGLSRAVLPTAQPYALSGSDHSLLSGFGKFVQFFQSLNKVAGVVAKALSAVASRLVIVRLDWVASVAVAFISASLPLSIMFPSWTRIVAGVTAGVWLVTYLSARRDGANPSYPPPCVSVSAAHGHVLAWVLARKDARGFLAPVPALSAAMGWFGYGWAVSYLPMFPVAATSEDLWGKAAAGVLAYVSVLGVVTRRAVREQWLLSVQANAEWGPRFEDTKATPRAATVVDREHLVIAGGEGEFSVTVDTMRATGDDRAAIMRAASSLNALIPEGIRLYALPLGARDTSGLGDKAGFRFVMWPEDAAFDVYSVAGASPSRRARPLSATDALMLRVDVMLADLGILDAWATSADRINDMGREEPEHSDTDDGDRIGVADDDAELGEEPGDEGGDVKANPAPRKNPLGFLGSLWSRLTLGRDGKKGSGAHDESAPVPGAYRVELNSGEALSGLLMAGEASVQSALGCDAMVSVQPPIQGVLLGSLDDEFSENSPVTAEDVYNVRQNAWWERAWNSALRKEGQNPVWQPAVSAKYALAMGGEIRFDAFMGRLASTSDQYFGLESKLLSALDIAGFAHIGPYVEDYQPRDGRIQAHDKAVYVAWMPKETSAGALNKVPSSPAFVRPVDDPNSGSMNRLAPHRARAPRRDENQGPKLLMAGMVTAAFLGAGLRPPIIRRPSIRLMTNFRAPQGSNIWAVGAQLSSDTFDVVQRALPKLKRALACDWVRIQEEPGGVTVFAGGVPSLQSMGEDEFAECARLDWAENWVTAKVVGADGQVPELVNVESAPDSDIVTRFTFRLPRTLTFGSVKDRRAAIGSASGYGFVEFEQDSLEPQSFVMAVAPHDPMPRGIAMDEELITSMKSIPVGVGYDGRVLDYDFERDIHILCLGKTGAGKTAAIQQYLTGALLRGWSAVVIDPIKFGLDFMFASDYLAAPIAGDLTSALATLEAVLEEVKRRKVVNREHGVGGRSDLPEDVKYPLLMVAIDEFTLLMAPEKLGPRPTNAVDGINYDRLRNDNLIKERIGGIAGRIAGEARSTGVALFLGTQILNADTLASIRGARNIKVNMSRLLLGSPNWGEISSGLKRPEERPHIQGTRDKGRGIWENGVESAKDIQVFFATQPTMKDVLVREGVERVLTLDVEKFTPQVVDEAEDVIDDETGMMLAADAGETVLGLSLDFDLDDDDDDDDDGLDGGGNDDDFDGDGDEGCEVAVADDDAAEPAPEPDASLEQALPPPLSMAPVVAEVLSDPGVEPVFLESDLEPGDTDGMSFIERAEEWGEEASVGDEPVEPAAFEDSTDSEEDPIGEDSGAQPAAADEDLDDDWGDDEWDEGDAAPSTGISSPDAEGDTGWAPGPGREQSETPVDSDDDLDDDLDDDWGLELSPEPSPGAVAEPSPESSPEPSPEPSPGVVAGFEFGAQSGTGPASTSTLGPPREKVFATAVTKKASLVRDPAGGPRIEAAVGVKSSPSSTPHSAHS